MKACIFFATLVSLVIPGLAQADYAAQMQAVLIKKMVDTSDTVSDDLEKEFWACWGNAYVQSLVPASDLPKLSAAADAGKWNDPLIHKYGEKAVATMKDPGGSDYHELALYMDALCPGVPDDYLSHYR